MAQSPRSRKSNTPRKIKPAPRARTTITGESRRAATAAAKANAQTLIELIRLNNERGLGLHLPQVEGRKSSFSVLVETEPPHQLREKQDIAAVEGDCARQVAILRQAGFGFGHHAASTFFIPTFDKKQGRWKATLIRAPTERTQK